MFYLDLFSALERSGVRYVIVEGIALNLHGVERATMDIYLAMALDTANWLSAIEVFHALQMTPIAPVTLDKIVGALRIPVASIDDLIAMKRSAGREIDRADIEALETLKRLGLDR